MTNGLVSVTNAVGGGVCGKIKQVRNMSQTLITNNYAYAYYAVKVHIA